MENLEILTEVNSLIEKFQEDLAKAAKGNKAALRRTRVTSNKLTKALKIYRKETIAYEKSSK